MITVRGRRWERRRRLFLEAGKKVAYIGVTKEDKAVGAAREDGFRAGLRSAGIELEEEEHLKQYQRWKYTDRRRGVRSIQVPTNGQVIIMMADRQTTGGYTKIGTVISVDLPKLAQAQRI